MNTHSVIAIVGCLLAFTPTIPLFKGWFPFDKHRPTTGIILIIGITSLASVYMIVPALTYSLIEEKEQELQMCLDQNKKIGIYKHLDLEN